MIFNINKIKYEKNLISALCTCAIVFACQKIAKNSGDDLKDNHLTNGVPLSSPDIENQLKWIAKGYSRVFENSTNRNIWHNYLATKDYNEEIHTITNPYFVTTNSINFDSEVKNAIDNDFPGNDYIQSVYFDFNLGNCLYSTGLRQVDKDLNTKHYRITYVPFNSTSQPMDDVYGYYIDSASGDVDSTLLTDDNYDDYDVYIVYAYSNCEDRAAAALPGCEANGICEPQKGETPENCEDCSTEVVNSGEFTLEVLSVTLKKDKHMFDESWIEDKYELGWNWLIAENNSGVISSNRISESEDDAILFNKWKREQIERCKANGTKCKGSATTKGPLAGTQLYHKFDPTTQSILIHFYEAQPARRGMGYTFSPKISKNPVTFSSPLSTYFSGDFDVKCKEQYGTFHTEQGPGNNGGGVIYVPERSTWTTEVIGGYNYYVIYKNTPAKSGDEITVKLGYKY